MENYLRITVHKDEDKMIAVCVNHNAGLGEYFEAVQISDAPDDYSEAHKEMWAGGQAAQRLSDRLRESIFQSVS